MDSTAHAFEDDAIFYELHPPRRGGGVLTLPIVQLIPSKQSTLHLPRPPIPKSTSTMGKSDETSLGNTT
jgi:hypothetical protein